MTADKIVIGLTAFACAVFAAVVITEIIREARTTQRTRAYEAGRDAAVRARRDADWRALKAEWLGTDFDAAPVLSHDPEVLGS